MRAASVPLMILLLFGASLLYCAQARITTSALTSSLSGPIYISYNEETVRCETDNDCAQGFGYCMVSGICGTCEQCYLDYCPDWCYCNTNSDCDKFPDDSPHVCMEMDYLHIDAKKNKCLPCSSGHCSNIKLADPAASEESCESLCPAQFECRTHEDCATTTATTTTLSSLANSAEEQQPWCTVDHQCQECYAKCSDLEARIAFEEQLKIDSTTTPATFRPKEGGSYDFACPESCCGWGMPEWEGPSYITYSAFARTNSVQLELAPCDSSLHFEAYWVRRARPNWTVRDFVRKGNKCDVKRHTFSQGSPSVVTEVDCVEAYQFGTCWPYDITYAIIVYDEGTSITDTGRFLGDAMPVVDRDYNPAAGAPLCIGLPCIWPFC